MKLILDSENIYGADIETIKTFLSNLSTEDVLELDRLVSDERNQRIEAVLQERTQSA